MPFEGCVTLITSEGQGYVKRSEIERNTNAVDCYNVIMTRAMSGGNKPSSTGSYQVIPATKRVILPGEICAETYICIGLFKDFNSANNLSKYLSTKFVRFLMLQALTSIMISQSSFQFVPLQDFSRPWTDADLYAKYKLTEDEISYIEKLIKPMD